MGEVIFQYQSPMRKVVEKLEFICGLSGVKALELFGRKGDWHVIDYAAHVSKLEIWEIDPQYRKDLKRNFPRSKIRIVDSFQEIKKDGDKFDLIVSDNSVYCADGDEYCEHFELFPYVFGRMNSPCILILNINTKPYNFIKGSEWWKRRARFYETDKPDDISFGKIDLQYRKICHQSNRQTGFSFVENRKGDIHYYILEVI